MEDLRPRLEVRYGALRAIAGVVKILAWLTVAIAVGASLILLATTGGFFGRLGAFVGALFLGLVQAVILFAVSEGIGVFLDIEENTRRMSQQLARLVEPAGRSGGGGS